MMKRLLSILIAAIMVLSLVPMSVFSQASDADDTYELTVSVEAPETVANPEVGDTLDVYVCISENSGLEAGEFAIEFNHDYLEVTGYNSTFSGGVYRLATTAYNNGTSDKFGCTAPTGDAMNYQGQTGGNPFGVAGHWYANFLCGVTTYEYDGCQVGGRLMRIRFTWTAIPTSVITLNWNALAVEATVDADTGRQYTEGNVTVENAVTKVIASGTMFTVTFKDWDGTVIDEQYVPYEGSAVAPEDPVREGFTFVGWDGDYSYVVDDVIITAVYQINTYTVTFVDWDGTVIDEQTVEYGNSAESPADPYRVGHSFIGWDTDFSFVEDDLVITAQYQTNTYTVTFVNGMDGSVIDEQTVSYGGSAVAPADPEFEGYTFAGWDTDFSCVEQDLIVEALWNIRVCTVTFTGAYTGSVNVLYGMDCELPVLNAEGLHYAFSVNGGPWYGNNITDDVTVFVRVENDICTVSFYDPIGKTVIGTSQVYYGFAVQPPEAPEHDGYTFSGWDADTECIKSDITINAVYERIPIELSIVSCSASGSFVEVPIFVNGSGYEAHGLMLEVNYDPAYLTAVKIIDGELMAGSQDLSWVVVRNVSDPGVVRFGIACPDEGLSGSGELIKIRFEVSADCISDQPLELVILEFCEMPIGELIGDPLPFSAFDGIITIYRHTVTYVGAYTGTEQVLEGGDASLPVLDAEGLHYSFTVNGEPWDGTNITEDITVTVSVDIDVYTVTFFDPIEDAVIDSQQVLYGFAASAPDAPVHYGYSFIGWDSDPNCIINDTTINALYEAVLYTVVFTDGFGNVISIQRVPYNTSAEEPDIPDVEGMTFIGWTAEPTCIKGDLVVHATWERIACTVSFTGNYTGSATVLYGDDCILPVYASDYIHYTFMVDGEYWDGENVTEDVSVTVGVAANSATFTVTFVDWDGTILADRTARYGTQVTPPDDPSREGYTFVGWNKDLSYVKHDMTVTALYEENDPAPTEAPVHSGKCGDDLTWSMDTETGVLTISGTGDMYDYSFCPDIGQVAPWNEWSDSIVSIIIEDGATSIGDWAFYNCSSLSSIEIPDSVASIGEGAFFGCGSLTSINIPSSVTSVGFGAFYGCASLESAVFLCEPPEEYAGVLFDECAAGFTIYYTEEHASSWAPNGETEWNGYPIAVTHQSDPNLITGVCGNNAYWTLDLTTGVLTITGTGDMFDFEHSIVDDDDCSTAPWYTYRDSINSVVISDGITSIGDYAFFCCDSLNSASIPGSVLRIGDHAFAGCLSLASINISEGVVSIGESAFSSCSSLTDITIPDSVTSIGDFAFYYCSALSTITIPNGVTSIGDYIFFCCSSLTDISIPDSVTSIGDYAFRGCTLLNSIDVSANNQTFSSLDGVLFNKSMTSIICYPEGKVGDYTISEGVLTISSEAFGFCSLLTSITIPACVTSIEDYAFKNCTSLTSAIFLGAPPASFGNEVFYGCASNFVIYYTAAFASQWAPNGETMWNGYPICLLETILGDVDCDGDIDFDDVTLLNAYLLNAAELSEQGLINANVNGDNKVSSADVVALNKLILGSN